MGFERVTPGTESGRFIECFWIVEEADSTPVIQKIIPDGFPEMIFHYGDPYLIKLHKRWSKQSRSLLGGQITNHFFLRNTGVSSILGIKFKPAAVGLLFDLDMHALTNRVVSLKTLSGSKIKTFAALPANAGDHTKRIAAIEDFLSAHKMSEDDSIISDIIDRILSSHGMISVGEMCKESDCSERQLERIFRKYIGLSPKLYSRIIRFAYVFQVVQEKKVLRGAELGLASGFYDQSHFIKNFKAFTGEDPSRYFFDQPNLANFFLRKSER